MNMKNKLIIEGTYPSGANLPPQLNTPSAFKKPLKVKYF